MKRHRDKEDVKTYYTRTCLKRRRKLEEADTGGQTTRNDVTVTSSETVPDTEKPEDHFLAEFRRILSGPRTVDLFCKIHDFLKVHYGISIRIREHLDEPLAQKDICKSIHDVIQYIIKHASSPSDASALEAACKLYGFLTNVTFNLFKLRRGLVDAGAAQAVASHMKTLHPFSKHDDLVGDVVDSGVMLLANCAQSIELRPQLKQHCEENLKQYLDDKTTTLDRVIDVISIHYHLQLTECLAAVKTGGKIFQRLRTLLSRAEYFEEDDLYLVCYYDSDADDETRTCTDAADILVCMTALGNSQEYQCKIREILYLEKEKVNMLMNSSDESDKTAIKDLLSCLKDHGSCKNCHGHELVKELLEKCENM